MECNHEKRADISMEDDVFYSLLHYILFFRTIVSSPCGSSLFIIIIRSFKKKTLKTNLLAPLCSNIQQSKFSPYGCKIVILYLFNETIITWLNCSFPTIFLSTQQGSSMWEMCEEQEDFHRTSSFSSSLSDWVSSIYFFAHRRCPIKW